LFGAVIALIAAVSAGDVGIGIVASVFVVGGLILIAAGQLIECLRHACGMIGELADLHGRQGGESKVESGSTALTTGRTEN
jgi:hypothetical protein